MQMGGFSVDCCAVCVVEGLRCGLEVRRLSNGVKANYVASLSAGGTEARQWGQSKLRSGTGKLSTNLN